MKFEEALLKTLEFEGIRACDKSDLERTLKVFCYHSENQCFLKIPSEEVTTLLSKSFFFSLF